MFLNLCLTVSENLLFLSFPKDPDLLITCEGDGDVVGVVTPLVRGGAQVLHGDQVVELSVLLEVHEKEEEGEDGEGQIEVERERRTQKETHMYMDDMTGLRT